MADAALRSWARRMRGRLEAVTGTRSGIVLHEYGAETAARVLHHRDAHAGRPVDQSAMSPPPSHHVFVQRDGSLVWHGQHPNIREAMDASRQRNDARGPFDAPRDWRTPSFLDTKRVRGTGVFFGVFVPLEFDENVVTMTSPESAARLIEAVQGQLDAARAPGASDKAVRWAVEFDVALAGKEPSE